MSRVNGGVLRKRGEEVDPGEEGRESAYDRIEGGGSDFSGMIDSVESKNRVSGFGEKLTPRRLPDAGDGQLEVLTRRPDRKGSSPINLAGARGVGSMLAGLDEDGTRAGLLGGLLGPASALRESVNMVYGVAKVTR